MFLGRLTLFFSDQDQQAPLQSLDTHSFFCGDVKAVVFSWEMMGSGPYET